MREIVLDTETTGLDPKRGDRLIEIGCVEIFNRTPTGVEFHRFIDPQRDVPADAVRIHGITAEMLKGKPLFAAVADEFLAFIGDAPLVIHNASFDTGFLNMELERVKKPGLDTARIIDTLALARRKHPAGPNSLDALCKRYSIDNTKRIKHGALVDSLLLASVYVELLGERQASLGLAASRGGSVSTNGSGGAQGPSKAGKARQRPAPLASRVTAEDAAAHTSFIETLGPAPLWNKAK